MQLRIKIHKLKLLQKYAQDIAPKIQVNHVTKKKIKVNQLKLPSLICQCVPKFSLDYTTF